MTTTITDKLVKAVIAATNAKFAGLVKQEEVTNITISIPYISITCRDGGSRVITLSSLEKYYSEHKLDYVATRKAKAKAAANLATKCDDQLFG